VDQTHNQRKRKPPGGRGRARGRSRRTVSYTDLMTLGVLKKNNDGFRRENRLGNESKVFPTRAPNTGGPGPPAWEEFGVVGPTAAVIVKNAPKKGEFSETVPTVPRGSTPNVFLMTGAPCDRCLGQKQKKKKTSKRKRWRRSASRPSRTDEKPPASPSYKKRTDRSIRQVCIKEGGGNSVQKKKNKDSRRPSPGAQRP